MSKYWDFKGLSEQPSKPFQEKEQTVPSQEFKQRFKPVFKSEDALYKSALAASKPSKESFRDGYDHKIANFALPFSLLNDNSQLQITHVIKTTEFARKLVYELSYVCYPGNPEQGTEMGLKLLLYAIAQKDIYVSAVEEYISNADWKQCCNSVRFLTFFMFLFAQNSKLQSGPILNRILETKAMKLAKKPTQADFDYALFYIDYYMQYYAQVSYEVPDIVKATMFVMLYKIKEKDTYYEVKNQRRYNLSDRAREAQQTLLAKLEKMPFLTSSVPAFSQLLVAVNNLSFAKLPSGLVSLLDREVVNFEHVDDKLLYVLGSELFSPTKLKNLALMHLQQREEARKHANEAAKAQPAIQVVYAKHLRSENDQTVFQMAVHRAFVTFIVLSFLLTLACMAIEPTNSTASLVQDFVAGVKKQYKWLARQVRDGYHAGSY